MLRKSRGRRGSLRRRLLEEGRDFRMSLAPLRAWKRRVGRVADQVVLEAELLISTQPGDGLSPNEVSPLERVEQLGQVELA